MIFFLFESQECLCTISAPPQTVPDCPLTHSDIKTMLVSVVDDVMCLYFRISNTSVFVDIADDENGSVHFVDNHNIGLSHSKE